MSNGTSPLVIGAADGMDQEIHVDGEVNGENEFSCVEANGILAFEGPEKLLEMWFQAKPDARQGTKDLRTVEQKVWKTVLDKVHCCVLSSISNEHVTAYLLSESSFFVYSDRIILKTCGTTTLLAAIPSLIEIADQCGLTVVEDVFYSRQNFFFPDKQLHPHKSFVSEVHYLDELFEHGAAYSIGRRNGDHYNFYNAERRIYPPEPDNTLEIMMTELDAEAMRRWFYADTFTDNTTKECGIADLLPGAIIDDFIFKPFGYSMNGILNDSYCTIHVTPQSGCSYASFETNVMKDDYTELTLQLLNIFKPQKFLVVTCSNVHKTLPAEEEKSLVNTAALIEEDFLLGERACYYFQHYRLEFGSYCKVGHPILSPNRNLKPVKKRMR